VPLVDAGLALAKRLELNATPTIVVNGWMFDSPPLEEELTKAAESILAGKDPYSRKGSSKR
jgi:protein-disulfide isomerase